ncbi:biotin transport system substrate-specific component [Brevibacterium aurantiacum]|uniref:Biotin transporter n=1 Tax=Brevibacterium aurantiacum TaxID=273384 RepID=A0A2H1L0I3_BREAU|nr:biotin transporter BioY [Brevibacterium aurantiacum]SMY05461.1 biotin transport system substrate-specific component [Brevibacterium aurantiacum]
MTPTHSTTSAGITRPRSAGTDIALIAVFAALIAAFAMMPPVPVGPPGVPITLQTFAIALCGMVLGPWRGFAATLLYVVLGLVGLPIFSGMRGGIGILAGPFGGSILLNPPLGILGMSINGDLPLSAAAAAGLIYWPGDIVKNILAASVALLIHRAFPDILRRRGVSVESVSVRQEQDAK